LQREAPIYYAAVAGDVFGTYQRWRVGNADERQTAATYSGQFFDLCTRMGRRGIVSFPSEESNSAVDPNFSVYSHPLVHSGSGIWFYFYRLRRAMWLLVDVLKSRASDVIVMDGITFFFLLTPIACFGKRIFLSIHTVPLQRGKKLHFFQRIIMRLDGWFIRRFCAGCLVASPEIARGIGELAQIHEESIALFYPTYECKNFSHFVSPDPTSRPFRLFYAGRIEIDKGIFDLLDCVHRLVLAGRNIELDYCGDGGALSSLREAIVTSGLSGVVIAHGHLNRPELLALLEKSQIVVVPTRSTFPEGLNQVVIEAVLARRPVVTSPICPAVELVSPAVVLAEPDDIDSYSAAIGRLIDDRKLFAEKTVSAEELRASFFDTERGWATRAFSLMSRGRPANS
jgi:glycosyltransferase involved in cell wall biosynthesis